MLSNKLTFSLVFVLMFTLVAAPAMAQTAGDDLNATAIAANGFVVTGNALETDGTNGFDGVTAITTSANVPDLADLLQFGGTIELLLLVNTRSVDVDSATDGVQMATLVTDDETADAAASTISEAAAAAAAYRLVITEIMWGLDGGSDHAQWIEVHNNGGALVDEDTVHLVFHRNVRMDRLGTAVTYAAAVDELDAGTYVVVDSVSTINRFNRFWAPRGQSGRTTVGPNAEPISNLVSMYRKRSVDAKGTGYLMKDGKPDGDKFADGTDGAQWIASAARINMTGAYIGTPGHVQIDRTGGPGTKDFGKAAVVAEGNAGTGVIINEFRSDSSDANVDWVELGNNSAETTDPISVKGWRLRLTTATLGEDTGAYKDHTDTEMAVLPDYRIPPGGILLIVNRDPEDTPLAGGVNLNDLNAAGGSIDVNRGAGHVYYIDARVDLPSSGDYLITLRSGDKTTNHEQFVDFAGAGLFPNSAIGTDVHPLRGWAKPGDFKASEFVSSASKASARNNSGANRVHNEHWESVGTKGGIGYDRDADLAASPGTPGYANDALENLAFNDKANSDATDDDMLMGTVTISEIMYDAGPRWNLVQWIELYNSSMTDAVNLEGWVMEIRNKEDVQSYVDSSFEFKAGATILPNQTLLLVSGSAANDVNNNRVYNLYQHHRRDLGLLARDSVLLSRTGFYLSLTARSKSNGDDRTNVDVVMDTAGNVDVDGAQRTVVWELPARDAAARQSLVRRFGTKAIDGTPDAADDGTMESSWVQSDLTGAGLAYYGHRNDIGTPGYRLGGPLPVSLSTFRPVRDKATGEVVITWVTESELNNAGFNILRADSKDGAFKVINLQGMIAGHGTTSEKHVYTYTDKTAKPNVAYYYQIEDVSLNGHRTTLRTTHMRGNVNASGKLTTTWSDLKLQK